MTVDDTATSSQRWNSLKTGWFNPKRKRFWAWVLLLIYTLAGFLLVPYVVKQQVTRQSETWLDRSASVEQVRFNPYVLSLQMQGLKLPDTDGTRLAGFDELFINFQLSSLFRWALTFREVRLDGLYLLYERRADGSTRLDDLLASLEANTPTAEAEPPATPDEEAGLLRFLVMQLNFLNGRLDYLDAVPPGGIEATAGPLSVSANNLNSLPESGGDQVITLVIDGETRLDWRGDLQLNPLLATGNVQLETGDLGRYAPYLQQVLDISNAGARLDAGLDYEITEGDDGLGAVLSGIALTLSDVSLAAGEADTEVLALAQLQLAGGRLLWPEQEVALERLSLDGLAVEALLDSEGNLNLAQLARPSPEGEATGDPAEPEGESAPWQVSLAEFALAGGRIAFTDQTLQEPERLTLDSIALSATGIDNREGTAIPLKLEASHGEASRLIVEGEAVALPAVSASATITLDALPLALAEPYAQQAARIAINSGALDLKSQVAMASEGALEVTGALRIRELHIGDKIRNEEVLAWESLAIDEFRFSQQENELRTSAIQLTQPSGRFHIAEDLSTNVGNLFIDSEEPVQEATGAAQEEDPIKILVAALIVEEGRLDFSDFSLPLQFATDINSLNGKISAFASDSARGSKVNFEGKVETYGLARIGGEILLMDPVRSTDVTMEFRNLKMNSYSPYSLQFAGYQIDSGSLDVELQYKIADAQLQGENSIVLTDIELGEKRQVEGAADLPLELAISLLAKPDGTIDLTLPVTGDINDPSFAIGDVVSQVLGNIILKAVTAPFKLLGGLVGSESEDFGRFKFLPGRSDLAPPEQEQAAKVAEALLQRPGLKVVINPAVDPEADTPALQQVQIEQAIAARLGREVEDLKRSAILGSDVESEIERLFAETFPDEAMEPIVARHTAQPVDNPEGKPELDRTGYLRELFDRVLAAEQVPPEKLQALARQRAVNIRIALLANEGLDAERISIGEPTETGGDGSEWVTLELGVDAG